MKKNYFFCLVLTCISFNFKSQVVFDTVTFDNHFNLQVDTFLNNFGDTTTSFGWITFYNSYDTSFGGYWSGGCAISTMTDTLDGSFNNLYSSANGSGFNNSQTYITVQPYFNKTQNEFYSNLGIADVPEMIGVYVNNSYFGYEAMKNGNLFSKKFGDTVDANGNVDGTNGQDYFFVRFYNSALDDSLDFYLSDFRFADPSQDYIIKDWTYVDLTSIQGFDKVKLFSSDVGVNGMNTPNYFCLDNFIFRSYLIGIEELISINATIYPNPTTDYIHIKLEDQLIDATIEILSISGQLVSKTASVVSNQTVVDVRDLPKGSYVLNVHTKEKTFQKQFVKQ